MWGPPKFKFHPDPKLSFRDIAKFRYLWNDTSHIFSFVSMAVGFIFETD